MTHEQQCLLSDLDAVPPALRAMRTAAAMFGSVQGASVTAECLHGVLLRELDRVCDALIPA